MSYEYMILLEKIHNWKPVKYNKNLILNTHHFSLIVNTYELKSANFETYKMYAMYAVMLYVIL